jgi:hypothetical protein
MAKWEMGGYSKLDRWVAKLGRWVAKLVARLLATAALWGSNPDIHPSKAFQFGDIRKSLANTCTLHAKKGFREAKQEGELKSFLSRSV